MSSTVNAAALVALLVAEAAHAESASPVYALTARLVVSPDAAAACVPDSGGQCLVALGDRVGTAYEEAIRKMFSPPPDGAAPDLEITLSAIRVDRGAAGIGSRVTVETRAVVAAFATGAIDELQFSGDAPILQAGEESLARAGFRALDESAARFHRAFADSPGVVNWLLARGIEPVGSSVAWPPRGERVTFGDLGGGYLHGVGDGATNGFIGKVGVEDRRWFIQGIAGRWTTSFDTAPSGSAIVPADLTAMDVGVEGGPVFRLGNSFEVRGGLGVHLLWGSAEVQSATPGSDHSFGKLVPSLFGTVQSSWWPTRGGTRVRAGLEIRRYVGTTVGFPDLARKIPIADTYVGVILGFEVPWGTKAKGGGR